MAMRASCITIGNFDGVHLGHQSLIQLAGQIARQEAHDLIILTFWPHPREVLPARLPHSFLTSREDRLALLKQFSPAQICEIPFTPELSRLSPAEFIEKYLLPLNMAHLVIGHDFTLGRGRAGNVEFLAGFASAHHFKLTQAPPFCVNGLPVSSTCLRDLIRQGDVKGAALLLGRPHRIHGTVVHGFRRGTGLGFPTANLAPVSQLLPANGVYATRAHIGGQEYRSVTNIGTNPTFDGKDISVETFLLDTKQSLYDQALSLDFVARLRQEQKFATPQDLVAQIANDIEAAKKILG